ncbi:MAG: hypothetical protein IPP51_02455 [Bacteroidetes bacterium]|nr:hypothetical protein [Bacteroidota bacterium]
MNSKIRILGFLICSTTLLFFACSGGKKSESEKAVTFSDIAPIVYKIAPCHRHGSGAPFNLISYDDVRSHLKTIELTVNSRLMPPWPADTAYSHFRDEKVMSKADISLLNEWIKSGAPEGDIKNIPAPPAFQEGSSFGKPDLVVKMRQPFLIKGNNKDNFIMLKVPYELPSDTNVRAIEIVPGNKKLAHHINAHLVQYEEGTKTNFRGGAPFVDTEKANKLKAFQMLDLQNDDGTYPRLTPSVTNYLPGVEVAIYPKGIGGYRVKKHGAILLDNIHYGPSPVDTSDVTTFNFFFSPKKPERPTIEMIIGTSGISPVEPPLVIPPNEIKTFISKYTLPQSISLLTVNPHMHLLGASFKAFAVTPMGDTIRIINIPKWDFRWQYFYTYEHMLKIPQGSTIYSVGTYDNTVNNPLNPFNPPQTVSEREGSMRTTDEMFQLICTFVPYQEGDENVSLLNEKLSDR